MTPIELCYTIFGLIVAALLVVLSITCVREQRGRAAGMTVLLLVAFSVVWTGWFLVAGAQSVLLIIPPAALLLGAVAFYWPSGRPRPLAIGRITEHVDERDVAFAREEYEPGTEKYNEYYIARPELKEVDDHMRRLPELLAPGAKYYERKIAAQVKSDFREIEAMTTQVDGIVEAGKISSPPQTGFEAATRRRTLGEAGSRYGAQAGRQDPTQQLGDSSTCPTVDAAEMTAWVKRELHKLGADEAGIAKLNPKFVYSHVGRGPEPWGQTIVNNHKFAIMFTLEMDYFEVEQAPRLPITRETARRYKQAAEISINLARRIREMGYPARAHIAGSNYQIMLPPVAYDAGLGELGRMGYLISPKFGARIRLGAITTDLALTLDKPITFGVQDFCDKCLKCSVNCPSGAIPAGAKTDVRGVEKWPLNIEQCIQYWRAIGTDCGLCMKVCPYSHPPTFVHNLVRAGCRRSSLARRIAIWADDFLYGRKLRLPAGPA